MRVKNFMKYLFCLFNIVLAGCSIYSMHTAVDIVSVIEEYTDVIGNKFCTTVDVIIVITGILFLLSILEIIFYWNAHYCYLITTGFTNLIILISLIGAGIGVLQIMSSQEDVLAMNIKHNMQKSFNDPYINRILHNLQINFECCGATGPEDYEGNIPECCCENCAGDIREFFKKGCAPVLSEFISEVMSHLSYICFALWSLLSFSTLMTVIFVKILIS